MRALSHAALAAARRLRASESVEPVKLSSGRPVVLLGVLSGRSALLALALTYAACTPPPIESGAGGARRAAGPASGRGFFGGARGQRRDERTDVRPGR